MTELEQQLSIFTGFPLGETTLETLNQVESVSIKIPSVATLTLWQNKESEALMLTLQKENFPPTAINLEKLSLIMSQEKNTNTLTKLIQMKKKLE